MVIQKVEKVIVDPSVIAGFGLDSPSEKLNLCKELFRFQGWVVSAEERVEKIEVFINGFHSLSLAVDVSRPDVHSVFPNNPAGDKLGYLSNFSLTLLPSKFQIDIFAKLSNGKGVLLFNIWGENPLSVSFGFDIKPISLTSLGRSGSTVLLALLGSHPDIVAYRPYKAEAHYIAYWMQIFLSLGDQKSWSCPMAADNRDDPQWIFGSLFAHSTPRLMSEDLFNWFFSEYTQEFFSFCMSQLQDFYRHFAEKTKKRGALYFVEKMAPDITSDRLLELVPESKEIFLVRDFRDVFCSIHAFNRKRKYLAFGRNNFETDEQYINQSLFYSANQLFDRWKLNQDKACLVKYEDLIVNQNDSLRKIFQYLELPADNNTIEEVIRKTMEKNQKLQKKHKTTENALSSVQRYKTSLSEEMLDICNRAFGNILTGFGYDI